MSRLYLKEAFILPLPALNIEDLQPAEYIQRGPNTLKKIIQKHFHEFTAKYTEKYDTKQGRLRLERIQDFTESFITCGDYTKGIARIECSNPKCDHAIMRPFSCKRFYFCPSCDAHGCASAGEAMDGHEPASQKRAILFGEHISNEVLLRLPHRHFVFAFPKMLRPYFKHNKQVLAEIARLINDMITAYYSGITGKRIRTGVVLAFQSFGDFLRFNPHFLSAGSAKCRF